MPSEQELLGQTIIDLRQKYPDKTAHEIHDALVEADKAVNKMKAFTDVTPQYFATPISFGNGNGSV